MRSEDKKIIMFCSVLSSCIIFCVRIVLLIIRISQIRYRISTNKIFVTLDTDADTDTKKFNNGCNRVNTVGLSESVWSK